MQNFSQATLITCVAFRTVLLLSTLATRREMRMTYVLIKIEEIRGVFKALVGTPQSNVPAGDLDAEARTFDTLTGIQEVLTKRRREKVLFFTFI